MWTSERVGVITSPVHLSHLGNSRRINVQAWLITFDIAELGYHGMALPEALTHAPVTDKVVNAVYLCSAQH